MIEIFLIFASIPLTQLGCNSAFLVALQGHYALLRDARRIREWLHQVQVCLTDARLTTKHDGLTSFGRESYLTSWFFFFSLLLVLMARVSNAEELREMLEKFKASLPKFPQNKLEEFWMYDWPTAMDRSLSTSHLTALFQNIYLCEIWRKCFLCSSTQSQVYLWVQSRRQNEESAADRRHMLLHRSHSERQETCHHAHSVPQGTIRECIHHWLTDCNMPRSEWL